MCCSLRDVWLLPGTHLAKTKRGKVKRRKIKGTNIYMSAGMSETTKVEALKILKEQHFPSLFGTYLMPDNVHPSSLSEEDQLKYLGKGSFLRDPVGALTLMTRMNAVSHYCHKKRWIAVGHLHKAVRMAHNGCLALGKVMVYQGHALQGLHLPEGKVESITASETEIKVKYKKPGVRVIYGMDGKGISQSRKEIQQMTHGGMRIYTDDVTQAAEEAPPVRVHNFCSFVVSYKEADMALAPFLAKRLQQFNPLADKGCVEYTVNIEEVHPTIQELWPPVPVKIEMPVQLGCASDQQMWRQAILKAFMNYVCEAVKQHWQRKSKIWMTNGRTQKGWGQQAQRRPRRGESSG